MGIVNRIKERLHVLDGKERLYKRYETSFWLMCSDHDL